MSSHIRKIDPCRETAPAASRVKSKIELNNELLEATSDSEVKTSLVLRLLRQGADVNVQDEDGSTPLINCAWSGGKDLVQILLKKGADVSKTNRQGITALTQAAIRKYSDIVEVLLNTDASKDSNQLNIALIEMALYGDEKLVEKLLELGANVNAQDENGNTPLISAAWRGHVNVVKILLKAGADINLENQEGYNARAAALHSGSAEVVVILQKQIKK